MELVRVSRPGNMFTKSLDSLKDGIGRRGPRERITF